MREASKARWLAQENHNRPPERKELDRVRYSYRVRYAKVGCSRFMGHLDLNRMIPRAVRRAGLTPSYSMGFHPIPQMSFGPPLRLGMAGLSEVMDLHLQEQLDPETLRCALADQFPEGLEIRSVHAIGTEAPKLSLVSNWADYLILLPEDSVQGMSAGVIDQLMEMQEILVEKFSKKGKRRMVDIRPGIADLGWFDEIPADCADLLAVRPDEKILHMRICLQGDHQTKPEEVLVKLFDGVVPASTQVIRRRMLPSPTVVLAHSH